jgi:hypothetical protein
MTGPSDVPLQGDEHTHITCEGYGPVPDEPKKTDIKDEEDSSSEGRTR